MDFSWQNTFYMGHCNSSTLDEEPPRISRWDSNEDARLLPKRASALNTKTKIASIAQKRLAFRNPDDSSSSAFVSLRFSQVDLDALEEEKHMREQISALLESGNVWTDQQIILRNSIRSSLQISTALNEKQKKRLWSELSISLQATRGNWSELPSSLKRDLKFLPEDQTEAAARRNFKQQKQLELEQITFENHILAFIAGMMEEENMLLEELEVQKIADLAQEYSRLETALEHSIVCEQKSLAFMRSSLVPQHRYLDHLLDYQQRTIAPYTRLFYDTNSLELHFGDDCFVVTPIDYRHLLALGRSRWGSEVENADLFAAMGGGSVMKLSSQDTFHFMRTQNNDLQLAFFARDVEGILKHRRAKPKIVQRLAWKSRQGRGFLTKIPFSPFLPMKSHYMYRFKVIKQNVVHSNTIRFLDVDTVTKRIEITAPHREGYDVKVDEKTLKAARLNGESGMLFVFEGWSSDFRKNKISQDKDHKVSKVFDLIFTEPSDRTKFCRLVQFYVLNYTYETSLYHSKRPRLRDVQQDFVIDSHLSDSIKGELEAHFPSELCACVLHQVFVEYLLSEGWSHGHEFSLPLRIHPELVDFDSLPMLARRGLLISLEHFFLHVINLGFHLKFTPGRRFTSTSREYFLCKYPELTLGDTDDDGIWDFIPLLAEHLHDLFVYGMLKDSYELFNPNSDGTHSIPRFSTTKTMPHLQRFHSTDLPYQDCRCNQVLLILKCLTFAGFELGFHSEFKRTATISRHDQNFV